MSNQIRDTNFIELFSQHGKMPKKESCYLQLIKEAKVAVRHPGQTDDWFFQFVPISVEEELKLMSDLL